MKNCKNLCKVCQEWLTNAEDGICAFCRRQSREQSLCKVCGEIWTASPDGICWKCWEKENEGEQRDPEALQKAIERTQLTLTILKYRAEGLSYANIAYIVELPVQTCYAMVERAIGEGKK